jgi:HK97 family phage major capsid protein
VIDLRTAPAGDVLRWAESVSPSRITVRDLDAIGDRVQLAIETNIDLLSGARGRGLLASEARRDRKLTADIDDLDAAIEAIGRNMDTYDDARRAVPRSNVRVGSEPQIYDKLSPNSYFRDHVRRQLFGDAEAAERLDHYRREVDVERRDLTTSDTAGGEFVPPQHLQSEWASLARAGRPFANALNARPIPSVGMEFTIPKVSTGSAAAVQATQNSAIQETDPVTAELTLPVATIAGMVDLSTQLFERSQPGMDDVIAADLAADYAKKLDVQLLSGSGNSGQVEGILTHSGTETVTYTAATPTLAGLYPKLADAINRVNTNRFLPPTAWVVHPRRWAFMLAALDTSNRPVITPVAPQNSAASFPGVAAESIVGGLFGLPVIADANIPTTDGAGTNEDKIIVSRLSDHYFAETGTPTVRVFESPGSGTLTVRIRVHGYIGFTAGRYPKATAKVGGTGLATPSFA